MYEGKIIQPMLIGKQQEAFDDPAYLFELKLDGIRCIAIMDEHGVDLRNKRSMKLLPYFPELKDIYHQAAHPCILDGELYVYKNGITDFYEVQKRALLRDPFKIQLSYHKYPATFTAFDILYDRDKELCSLPLFKRKYILDDMIQENARINISRYVEEEGIALFQLTTKQHLEGIVAKKRDSRYYPNKRTKEWIKCKNMIDEDYIIIGYITKEKNIHSLILAQYNHNDLIYKGHVTLGVSLSYIHSHTRKTKIPPDMKLPKGNEHAIWIKPYLVGIVQFMDYTQSGGMRQSVFKGFRDDKKPEECQIKQL